MTMWGPHAGFGEDISKPVAVDPPCKRRRSRRRAWRDGLSDQTVVTNFEDVRAYRAFERAVIGSVDPRSAIELELVHRLASLMWRLRRASAIETGLFEIQGELSPRAPTGPRPAHAGQPDRLQPPTQVNGHNKVPGSSTPHHVPVSEREPLSTSMHLPLAPWSRSRSIAQCFLRLSNLDPTLLGPHRPPTKRDCGAKRRKPFGPSTRCDNRRLQCGNDCVTASRPSPGIGRAGHSPPVAPPAAMTRVASAVAHCVNRVKAGRVIRSVHQHVRPCQSTLGPSRKFTGVRKCVEETSRHFCRNCPCLSPNPPMNLMLCGMLLNERSSRAGS